MRTLMDLVVKEWVRKPQYVMAIRVTEENMEQIAEWCGGTIRGTGQYRHIKVRVHKPMNIHQTKASVGNWVLKQDVIKDRPQFKVYTDQAFVNSFNPAFDDEKTLEAVGSPIHDKIVAAMQNYVVGDVALAELEQEGLFEVPPPSNPFSENLRPGPGTSRPDGFAVGPNTGTFARYQRGELNEVTNRPAGPPVFQNLPGTPGYVAQGPSEEDVRVFQNLPTGPDTEWPIEDPRHPRHQEWLLFHNPINPVLGHVNVDLPSVTPVAKTCPSYGCQYTTEEEHEKMCPGNVSERVRLQIQNDMDLINDLVRTERMTVNRARQIADMFPEERAIALSTYVVAKFESGEVIVNNAVSSD